MPQSSYGKKAGMEGVFSFIDNRWAEAGIILAILIPALLIRAYGISDNGYTWDEEITVNAGTGYINYLTSFMFDGPAWYVNNEHPPVAKYLYGLAVCIFDGGTSDIKSISFYDIILGKWVSALMGVATCVLVYLVCRAFFDRWIGLASALILAFTPVFLAHNQIAALESPLAFFFTLTMFLVMMMLKTSSKAYFIMSAISLGVLMDVKFNAILILPVILIFYLLYRHGHMPATQKKKMKGRQEYKEEQNLLVEKLKAYFPPGPVIAFCLIALVVWFVLWPWLWYGTADRLSTSLSHWAYIPGEYFLGDNSGVKPLYYYPVYLLVTTPLLLFIPLVVGLCMALTSRDAFKYAIVLWFAVPFVYGFSSFVQGGMRYIIMIYPAMAILCGLGLATIAGWAGRLNVPRIKAWAMPAFTAIIVVYLIVSVLSARPYYLDYYNSLAGGGQNIEAHDSFNIGWWGEGVYEAEKYVDSIASPNATTYEITLPAFPHHKQYNLHSRLLQVNVSDEYTMGNIKKYLNPNMSSSGQIWGDENYSSWKPDYIIVNRYMEEYYNVTADPAYYKLIYTVSVQGAPIVKVYKVAF